MNYDKLRELRLISWDTCVNRFLIFPVYQQIANTLHITITSDIFPNEYLQQPREKSTVTL